MDRSFVKVPLYVPAISGDYAIAKLITLSISSKLSTLPFRKSLDTCAARGRIENGDWKKWKNGKPDEITLGHVAPRNYVPFADKNDEKLSKAIAQYARQSKFHFDF